MKLSLAILPALLARLATADAIRLIKGSEALDLFGKPLDRPFDVTTIVVPAYAPAPGPTKGEAIWDWVSNSRIDVGGSVAKLETGYAGDKEHGNKHGHHHKHMQERPRPIDAKPLGSGWLTAIYALGSPRPSKFIGSDNPDEDAIVEAMLNGISQPDVMELEQQEGTQAETGHTHWHKVDEGNAGRGRHGRHGHHGQHGVGRQAKCLKGRLLNALSSLRPAEAGFLAFTVGAGLGSLLRIVFMFILLAKRSHAYMNEQASDNTDSSEDYPGAVYRARRAESGEAAEAFLPAYTESAGSDEKAVAA